MIVVKNERLISNTKKIFFGSVMFIFAIVILIFVSPTSHLAKRELRGASAIPHHNLIDTQISQYSDKNITKNAIVTNSEFKNIAFDNVPNQSFFSNQIATVVRSIESLTSPTKKEETKEYGSWVWTPIMQMTPEYIKSILSDAKANGINTMYVSVDTYLDIFVMEKGGEKDKQRQLFENILENFIAGANQKGIKVDAEAGWQNWAEAGNEYKAFAAASFVKNFNAAHQNKFRGFQYDIEPYMLDSYKKNEAAVLKNFVTLIDQTENFLADNDLRFSVVVPDFWDGKDGMTPQFSYDNNNDYVFKHLLDILDKKPDSSIIIMSYRNLAVGDDGSIEVSSNEMQTAKNHNTKIVIAQETGDVPPPYITFYNTSKKYLTRQINNINAAFNANPNFGGIAVHYINTFLALK
jgi:hypothetical protein